MKNIIVTGGCGFIGSNLCEFLIDQGDKVMCIDNLSTGYLKNIDKIVNNKNFTFVEHDVKDVSKIYDIIKKFKPEQIYHLACPASPKQYQKKSLDTLLTSIHGTENMLKVAHECQARFLLASTSEIYGDPLCSPQDETYFGNVNTVGERSCYDEGKRVAETLTYEYHKTFGINVRIARIFNTYGPGLDFENDGRVVSNFIFQCVNNLDITVYGNGRQTRCFCYVDDMINGLTTLMNDENNIYIGPVNLGNPEEITVNDLVEQVVELINGYINGFGIKGKQYL